MHTHSWPRGYDQKNFHVQFLGFKYSLMHKKITGKDYRSTRNDPII